MSGGSSLTESELLPKLNFVLEPTVPREVLWYCWPLMLPIWFSSLSLDFLPSLVWSFPFWTFGWIFTSHLKLNPAVMYYCPATSMHPSLLEAELFHLSHRKIKWGNGNEKYYTNTVQSADKKICFNTLFNLESISYTQ